MAIPTTTDNFDKNTLAFWNAFGFDIQSPPPCMFECLSGDACDQCSFLGENGKVVNPWLDSGMWKREPAQNPFGDAPVSQKITKSDGTFDIDRATLSVDIKSSQLVDLTLKTSKPPLVTMIPIEEVIELCNDDDDDDFGTPFGNPEPDTGIVADDYFDKKNKFGKQQQRISSIKVKLGKRTDRPVSLEDKVAKILKRRKLVRKTFSE
jgi:hypothetical protein